MKSIKLAIAALVIAAGAFGAFAFSNANTETEEAVIITSSEEAVSTVYYAIRNPPESTHPFRWTDDPSEISDNDLECLPLTGASCSVIADTPPADGQMPPGQNPTGNAYQ